MRLLAIASIVTLALAPVGVSAQEPSTESPVASTSATSAAASDSDDTRIRCRRIPVTGSHVRVARVCKTVGEWRRLSERGNDVVRDQADTGRVCAGGEFCRGN